MNPLHIVKKSFRFFVIASLVSLTACDSLGVTEQLVSFEKQVWPAEQKPSFQMELKDTNASYNIYFVLRHTDSYPYKNIWIAYGHQYSGEKGVTVENKNLTLADDATGWRGAAMVDIIEQRILLTPHPVKIKPGTCNFQVEHLMRINPLPQVLHAGIRLERIVE